MLNQSAIGMIAIGILIISVLFLLKTLIEARQQDRIRSDAGSLGIAGDGGGCGDGGCGDAG